MSRLDELEARIAALEGRAVAPAPERCSFADVAANAAESAGDEAEMVKSGLLLAIDELDHIIHKELGVHLDVGRIRKKVGAR